MGIGPWVIAGGEACRMVGGGDGCIIGDDTVCCCGC